MMRPNQDPEHPELSLSAPIEQTTRRKGQGDAGHQRPPDHPAQTDAMIVSVGAVTGSTRTQSSDCSSEGRMDAPLTGETPCIRSERYRDKRSVLAEEERQSMMALVADLQRPLVAIKRSLPLPPHLLLLPKRRWRLSTFHRRPRMTSPRKKKSGIQGAPTTRG